MISRTSTIARFTDSPELYLFNRSNEAVRRVKTACGWREDAIAVSDASKILDAQSAFEYEYLRLRTRPELDGAQGAVRIADLFCGCGGMSLGAREACRALGRPFVAAFAVDSEPSCTRVYAKNIEHDALHTCDIERLVDGNLGSDPTASERKLKELAHIDILLAGPPCQGNSDLNNYTRRNDERNLLFERAARFVELMRPDHVLIENVPSVIHGKEGVFEMTLKTLEDAGYRVDHDTVDASLIGIPQRRRRRVLIGSRTLRPKVSDIVAKFVTKDRTVRWAIGDIADEEPVSAFTRPSAHTRENIERMAFLHKNDLYDLPNRLRPKCHRSGTTYKAAYGRLKWDEPANTITSGFGSPGQGRYVHPSNIRTLTPHEAARLQFFPDYFDFGDETKTSLARMIGNAVPSKLSYIFCMEILSSSGINK